MPESWIRAKARLLTVLDCRLLLLRLLYGLSRQRPKREAWSAYLCHKLNEVLKNLVTSTLIILKGVLEIYDPNGESCVHSAQGRGPTKSVGRSMHNTAKNLELLIASTKYSQ
jgi:hypothetical protein